MLLHQLGERRRPRSRRRRDERDRRERAEHADHHHRHRARRQPRPPAAIASASTNSRGSRRPGRPADVGVRRPGATEGHVCGSVLCARRRVVGQLARRTTIERLALGGGNAQGPRQHAERHTQRATRVQRSSGRPRPRRESPTSRRTRRPTGAGRSCPSRCARRRAARRAGSPPRRRSCWPYQHPWNAHAGVDEPAYLELVLKHSREHGQLYPYHLAAALHDSLRSPMSPFEYYVEVLYERMSTERSYDTIPNFAAADCMRLLKVGRNEFIHALNACRAKGWMWKRRKAVIVKQLPARPADDGRSITGGSCTSPRRRSRCSSAAAASAPARRGRRRRRRRRWCAAPPSARRRRARARAARRRRPTTTTTTTRRASPAPIVDPGGLAPAELEALQTLHAAGGSLQAGRLARAVVPSLYAAGLVRYDVPVGDGDRISVPPLSGFVMNRVGNDYLEKLLYEVFVTNDESLTVAQLAALLGQPPPLVTAAVSVACRLGFAQLKTAPPLPTADATAPPPPPTACRRGTRRGARRRPLERASPPPKGAAAAVDGRGGRGGGRCGGERGVGLALLVDSKIAACLMMSNLAAELKQHAVTLYEVGKIPHESLDDFLVAAAEVERPPPHEAELWSTLTTRSRCGTPPASCAPTRRRRSEASSGRSTSCAPSRSSRSSRRSAAGSSRRRTLCSCRWRRWCRRPSTSSSRTPLRPAPPAARTSAPPRRRSSRRGSRSSFTTPSAPARRRSSSAAAAASARCRRTSHPTRRCASSLGRASLRSSAAAPPSPPPTRCSSTLRSCCSRTRRPSAPHTSSSPSPTHRRRRRPRRRWRCR